MNERRNSFARYCNAGRNSAKTRCRQHEGSNPLRCKSRSRKRQLNCQQEAKNPIDQQKCYGVAHSPSRWELEAPPFGRPIPLFLA